MVKDEKFVNEIVNRLQDHFGSEYKITVDNRLKNNKIRLTCVEIQKKGDSQRAAIYLDAYYQQYQLGMTMEEIITDMEHVCKGGCTPAALRIYDVQDFEKIKERICFKLINHEKNKELLQTIPYVPIQDLAVVFYLYLNNNASGQLTAVVDNELMEAWGTTVEELFHYVRKNTPFWFPVELRSMKDLMKDIVKEQIQAEFDGLNLSDELDALFDDDPVPMYVLSNKNGINGAAVILYPGAREMAAEKIGRDLVILPSSVHEVLLMAYDEEMDKGEMRHMVQTINRTDVLPEDVLSDNVYCYHSVSDEVEIWKGII